MIKIKESKKGTFTKAAKQRGLGVQEFARKVLANKDQYSTAMVKKANFARNSAKWKKELGGTLNTLSALRDFSSLGDLALPGLGPVLSASLSILQAGLGKKMFNENIEKSLAQQTINTNPFGFALGGVLKGKEDLGYYKGRSHISGGILTNPKGIPSEKGINEVEGEETLFKYKNMSYIFSDKLKI